MTFFFILIVPLQRTGNSPWGHRLFHCGRHVVRWLYFR